MWTVSSSVSRIIVVKLVIFVNHFIVGLIVMLQKLRSKYKHFQILIFHYEEEYELSEHKKWR
jgi:hypothetical protein